MHALASGLAALACLMPVVVDGGHVPRFLRPGTYTAQLERTIDGTIGIQQGLLVVTGRPGTAVFAPVE